MLRSSCIALVVLAGLAGCEVGPSDDAGDDAGSATSAAVTLTPTTGNTTTGSATFTKSGAMVTLVVTISAGTPGMHGMHIHDGPDCGADGMAAGSHWNPDAAHEHGLPAGVDSHIGDLGNIDILADGTGTLTIAKPVWTINDGVATDVASKALMLHGLPDDGTMMSAGPRVACGTVIVASP